MITITSLRMLPQRRGPDHAETLPDLHDQFDSISGGNCSTWGVVADSHWRQGCGTGESNFTGTTLTISFRGNTSILSGRNNHRDA